MSAALALLAIAVTTVGIHADGHQRTLVVTMTNDQNSNEIKVYDAESHALLQTLSTHGKGGVGGNARGIKQYNGGLVAVVNNGSTELEEIALLVLFYERSGGPSGKREQVSSRPLFYEGPLLPGQALKWSTEAEGTEVEIQGPALGSLGPEGESAAPTDRFFELLKAQNRPVRLHGAMMLAFLGDPRARDGALGLSRTGCGCTVRNRYTVRCTNGTSRSPRMPTTALKRARSTGSSTVPRSAL